MDKSTRSCWKYAAPDLEEHGVAVSAEHARRQLGVGRRHAAQRRPGAQLHVRVELRHHGLLGPAPPQAGAGHAHAEPQPHAGAPPPGSLPAHRHQVAAEQKGVVDLFTLLICPESLK